MPYTCAVAHCQNDTRMRKLTPPKSFFQFPKDPQRLKAWLKACNRSDLENRNPKTLHNSCRICSDHFEANMFLNDLKNRLHDHAIPTVFDSLSTLPMSDRKRPLPSTSEKEVTTSTSDAKRPCILPKQEGCELEKTLPDTENSSAASGQDYGILTPISTANGVMMCVIPVNPPLTNIALQTKHTNQTRNVKAVQNNITKLHAYAKADEPTTLDTTTQLEVNQICIDDLLPQCLLAGTSGKAIPELTSTNHEVESGTNRPTETGLHMPITSVATVVHKETASSLISSQSKTTEQIIIVSQGAINHPFPIAIEKSISAVNDLIRKNPAVLNIEAAVGADSVSIEAPWQQLASIGTVVCAENGAPVTPEEAHSINSIPLNEEIIADFNEADLSDIDNDMITENDDKASGSDIEAHSDASKDKRIVEIHTKYASVLQHCVSKFNVKLKNMQRQLNRWKSRASRLNKINIKLAECKRTVDEKILPEALQKLGEIFRKGQYSSEARKFAMELYNINPQAYGFMRKYLPLPEPFWIRELIADRPTGTEDNLPEAASSETNPQQYKVITESISPA